LSIDAPGTALLESSSILDCLKVWGEERSAREYVSQIGWHLLEPVALEPPMPAADTYFPRDLIELAPNESIVDCGAFIGDTIRAVLERVGDRFKEVLALEPDPGNFAELNAFVAELPAHIRGKIQTARVAVHSERANLRFGSAAGAASSLLAPGDVEVDAVSLDELLADRSPTFVKMDIEGAEPDAIAGAVATLRQKTPALAVCLYHRRDHLWRLPLAIRMANPAYRFHLRRYSDDCWETVCYAVGPHRMAPSGAS
jgi:FkbM family methyltransferase